MRVLAHLLVGSMLLLPACSLVFSQEDPASDSGPAPAPDSGLDPTPDSGLAPACEGLALLRDNFEGNLNTDMWWIAMSGGADATRSAGSLRLNTSANEGQRGVAFGTYDEVPMAGTLAIEVLEIDLASDLQAAFYLRLDSADGTRELGLSITPDTLSLFDAASVPLPSTPFWLVLSIDGNTATLYTSADGSALSDPNAVYVANKPVTLLFGLSAAADAKAVEHTVRLGQIGDLPAQPCQ